MQYSKAFVISFIACLPLIDAHSYITIPTSRSNQAQTQTGCRGPACLGPCDKPLSSKGQVPVTTIKRGDPVLLTWPRNNHAGGFIRVAWSLTADSDSHAGFDKMVQHYACHEMTCKSSTGDPLGGDSDGGSPGKCTTSIQVPAQLTDAEWTMQWVWYGGAYALGDYYSCVDYKISGGAASTPGPVPITYDGGDVHNPGTNKCLFFNTDRPHLCVNEPCSTGNLMGKNNGVPFGINGATAGKSTVAANPAPVNTTTATPAVAPAAAAPVVTAAPVVPDSSPAAPATASTSSSANAANQMASADGKITVSYTVTSFDKTSGLFNSTLVVTNNTPDIIPSWETVLLLPPSNTLLTAYGAFFQLASSTTAGNRFKITAEHPLDRQKTIPITGKVAA